MRQLIVDLRMEMPNISIREIAEICDTRFQRRPSHHSIKTVLASGPPPSIQMSRFPPWNDTPDPAQRRHNNVQLHAEGWSVASIAEYLAVSKQTVYTTLKRWWQEGVKGLDDKSHARKAPRKVTLEVAKEVKNPRLIETGYQSPQLKLWTLGLDEWLLFLKLPDYVARKKPQRKSDVIQLPLPDLDENQRKPGFFMSGENWPKPCREMRVQLQS